MENNEWVNNQVPELGSFPKLFAIGGSYEKNGPLGSATFKTLIPSLLQRSDSTSDFRPQTQKYKLIFNLKFKIY